ncbi:MAG: serine/threonine protein kinase [Gemmatimonadota bacterium]|nr:MAG: serine/threonine protein kinase [Gemmatimonadota bacterium]
MHPDRLQQIQELFWQALEREPTERASFLAGLRAEDPDLADDVESLLAADLEAGDFLDGPPSELLAAFERYARGLEAGDRIGPYAILKRLGRGGMGSVYLAERADAEYRKQVAIKIVRPGMDTEEILHRFWRERQILANLEHPNIARLLDGGTTPDGHPYLVMEYVDGEPIQRYCDGRRLSVDERLRLFVTVCGAVEHAHRNLVVHRDLKPGNILVTAGGVPKLLDFGIAKLLAPLEDSPDTTATRTGLRPMSPVYASPEQVKGGPITTSTDVYSLGLVLYELLTGLRPQTLEGLSFAEIERAVCEREPERPSTAIGRLNSRTPGEGGPTLETIAAARSASPDKLRRRLIGDLDNIVMRALNKEPGRRYRSVEELADDIRRHLGGFPVRARPETLRYRAAKFVRRHRVGVAAAALVAVTLVAGMAGTLWQARRATSERDRARTEAETAQQVAGFLTDLFQASDPTEALGDTIPVREILERGRRRISETLQEQPEVRATMLTVLGRVYGSLGRYADARALVEEALELRRQAYGTPDPRVAETLETLGFVLRDGRNTEEAKPVWEEALLLRRLLAASRRDDPDGELQIAADAFSLGYVMRDLGEPDSAETLLSEALEIRRRIQGEDHLDVILAMGGLAYVMRVQGKLDEAEALYREVLASQRALGDSGRAWLPPTLNNLAYVLRLKEDYAAAESLYREALSVHQSLYGEAHHRHNMFLNNLASVLDYQGKYDEVEAVLREALRLERTHRPMGDWRLVSTLVNGLGRFLSERGRCAEAEPLLREALEIIHNLPSGHRWTSEAQSMLGACLGELGRFAEAEPLLIQGYDGLSAPGGVQTGSAETALERLLRMYEAWGRTEMAETYRSQLEAMRAPADSAPH